MHSTGAALAIEPEPVPVENSTENVADNTRPPSPIVPSAPSPPPPGPGGRPRHIRLPKRFRDEPPAPPTAVEHPVEPRPEPNSSVEPDTDTPPRAWVQTDPNIHGLYKVFPCRPTHDPDESVSLDDLCKSSELLVAEKIPSAAGSTPSWFPFLNSTVARLMTWFHMGSNLSIAALDSPVDDVLLQDDYDPAHLVNFSAARENKCLDDTVACTTDDSPAAPDDWKTASVKIKLPA
ncbi:hypothetical protein B0H10DRAFT_1960528 [Mycena sp. CBHHK59/15]|nr:hypothetical protein B0H10DRAFT_1960528 [Mycena sp. CBHHK59/15]